MSTKSASLESYQELSKLVRKAGYYEKAPGRMLIELVVHLTAHFGGVALFAFYDELWIRAIALLLMGYGGIGITTSTHTSSHNAVSRKLWINRALTFFGYPFLFGASANYWWNKHCVVHHPSPNVIGVDEDVDLMPFFAVTQRDFEASRGLRRLMYRLQWVVIVPSLAFNTFFTQYQGWRYFLPELFDSKKRRLIHWVDLFALLGHWTAFLVVPMFFFDPLSVIGLYVVRNATIGFGMFIAFAPAHFPDEAAFIEPKDLEKDYLLRQTATTVNFRTGFLGRLVCGGVEYQIEHHLFPGVPHVYYPKLSAMVKEYCEERGYPYRTLGWGEGLWKSLVTFYRPKEILALEDAVAKAGN